MAVQSRATVRRYALAVVVLVAVLVVPSVAGARSIAEDLADAHAYWGTSVCEGRWDVLPDVTLSQRLHAGEATGVGFTANPEAGLWVAADGGRWDWYVARCEFTMDPALQGCARYRVVLHEVGHFVYGPGHSGPMAPGAVDVAPCPIQPAARASGRHAGTAKAKCSPSACPTYRLRLRARKAGRS